MNFHPGFPGEAPPPDALLGFLFGTVTNPMGKLPILRATIELKVCASITAGHHSAYEIASATGADLVGMRCLLDALVVMKLLEKDASRYRLPNWVNGG